MRIRMLVDMPEGASRNGEAWPAKGEPVELPTADAAHLVASGVAEEVTEPDAEDSEQPRRRRKAQTEGEAP
ncbi:hypothetical protein ACFYRN_09990 [Streptomyces sp. NPDC005227]|uniref:hypothetical protein n=1 Tax=Streptomyces sp. NPDC005227 TaxID=3364707 RepID=UPI00368B5A12